MSYTRRFKQAPRPRRRLVVVRITDTRRPKNARWLLQQAVVRAGGFNACRGLTDQSVRLGRRHAFWVRDTLTKRFLRDIGGMVADRRLIATVDGNLVRAVRR